MICVNNATLIGRIGKDPELKYTQNGAAVCTFSVATSKGWKDDKGQWHEETTWHNIVSWNKQAEWIHQNLKKGSLAYISGEICNRKYENKKGETKYISEIISKDVVALGPKQTNTDEPSRAPTLSEIVDSFPESTQLDF